MKIQLINGISEHTFKVDKETSEFIQAHLDRGRNFDILFPDFEEKQNE